MPSDYHFSTHAQKMGFFVSAFFRYAPKAKFLEMLDLCRAQPPDAARRTLLDYLVRSHALARLCKVMFSYWDDLLPPDGGHNITGWGNRSQDRMQAEE